MPEPDPAAEDGADDVAVLPDDERLDEDESDEPPPHAAAIGGESTRAEQAEGFTSRDRRGHHVMVAARG